MPTYAAVDLGATSGRVVNVVIDSDRITLDPVHRFGSPSIAGPNGALHWDMDRLRSEVGLGLERAAERTLLRSAAIDSWAVDYGLLDADGEPVAPVHAYRSRRTAGVMESVIGRLGTRESVRDHRHPVPAVQHPVSTRCFSRERRSRCRFATVDDPGSHQQSPLRQHDERGHEREHDPTARRPHAPMEHRAV